MVRSAAGDKAVSGEFGNFVRLLAENRRLALLPEIVAMFETLKAEAEKSIHAEVISAFEIGDEQKARIAAALKQRLQREIAAASQRVPTAMRGQRVYFEIGGGPYAAGAVDQACPATQPNRQAAAAATRRARRAGARVSRFIGGLPGPQIGRAHV